MAEPIILSFGSVNMDFQVRVDRPPEVGEMLLGHDFVRLSGGKAANVGFLARRLGVGAQLLAQVGDDILTEWALKALREVGIDLSQTCAVKGAMPGIAMIAVPPDGKKTIILAASANLAWSEADAARDVRAIEQATRGSVLVVDYEVPGFVVESAVKAGRRRGLVIVLDPSPADRVEHRLLARVDVLVPNSKEAEADRYCDRWRRCGAASGCSPHPARGRSSLHQAFGRRLYPDRRASGGSREPFAS